MKYFITLVLLYGLNLVSWSQTPAHFFLGENEFSGIHIYDLIQDQELDYFVSTNNGIYKYDGYTFKKYDCENMLSPSIFNLVCNSQNVLYCNNLSGQIFQIKNDTCTLFFQIPDSLITAQINLGITSNDRLIVMTDKVYELEPNLTLKSISDSYIYSEVIHLNNELIICHSSRKGPEIIYFDKNETEIKQLICAEGEYHSSVIFPVIYKGELIFIDRAESHIYTTSNDTSHLVSTIENISTNIGMYASNDELWVLKSSLGVYCFTDIYNPNMDGLSFFEDYQISSFCLDHEGNILLGTFDHGIIVIPKSEIINVNLRKYNQKVSHICVNPSKGIAFGTLHGKFGYLNELGNVKNQTIREENPIEIIEYINGSDELLIGGKFFSINAAIDFKKSESDVAYFSSPKDLKNIPNNQCLVASNTGISIYNTNGYIIDPITGKQSDNSNKISQLYRGRTYSVGYDSINSSVYIGSSVGLKLLNKNGLSEIKLNNAQLLSKNMVYLKGKMYVTCHNNGIIVFKDDEISAHWTIDNILVSNSARLIRTDGENIFVTLDEGIQIISSEGKVLYFLNQSEGLRTKRVADLEIYDDFLWILSENEVQKLDLKALNENPFIPNITLKSVHVNNSEISLLNKVNEFNPTENKFVFNFVSKSLKHKHEISYLYRLTGVENLWQEKPYLEHIIEYKTLPPGEYDFQVKALYRSNSSDTIHFPFTITAPFWTKWWFYAAIVTLLLLLVYLYFRKKMLKQRKKAKLQQELYESKLTAIQAQMNPHFIFNSLNSIQDLVLKNDAENAYNYISKFALLVRNTLNHSDKDFIELADELKALNLYLELEKLRFKSAFDYSIETMEDIDIMIPPMLLQPFIENSLIHGLLHKTGHKHLSLTFELSDSLICTISDNGIGRKEAKLIQQRQYSDHESFALKAIKKRLEILELRYGGKFLVEYSDLYEDGIAKGTVVILKIPYVKNY